MLNIIMCGAPGSGKGTQSDRIVEKYHLAHISTGDLLRKEIASGSERGNQLNAIISRGELVPDDIMVAMLGAHIDALGKDCKGVIFDGFPRNVAQAEALEQMLAERGLATSVLLDMQVEREELIDRLLNRGKISGRSDDNLETIQQRLIVYEEKTKPVSGFYEKLGKYQAINGMGTMDEIFHRIEEVIEDLKI